MDKSPDQFNGEVLDVEKAFRAEIIKKPKRLFIQILISSVWTIFFFNYLSFSSVGQNNWVLVVWFPWFLFFVWFVILYSRIQTAFWKQLAFKYGWEYEWGKNLAEEKGLLFQIGHSKKARHGIVGSYSSQPFYIFEYRYSIGKGKSKVSYSLTVFEVKFTGTFPHLYLNFKGNWYSNSPSFFSSLANISVPGEFVDKFKLYAPKEYEIETLEIFTPEVFEYLIDSGWDYDMEFVDGELVIYNSKEFNNFTDLDAEIAKIKKFVDILAPRLNKLKLTKIGDISPTLNR